MYEADLNVVLFTANYGKIDARAKSVRRPKAKLASLKSPLSSMIVELTETKIPTVTGVKITKPRSNLALNLENVKFAMALCELVEKITKPRDPHPEIFQLLEKKLDTLEKTKNPELVFVSGALQILQKLGFLGEIKNCAKCGNKISGGEIYFGEEGLACSKCETLEKCPLDIAKILLFVTQCHDSDLEKIKISKSEIQKILKKTQDWIKNTTDKNLKSLY